VANVHTSEAMRAVLKRASVDRTFRAQLLTNPREALARQFGIVVPEQYRIRFIERHPDVDALVVLPDCDAGEGPGDELSDAALEGVSGGGGGDDEGREYTWSDEPPEGDM
jgi:hypothetical protein